jgi:cobyrinic acid a,c-diamide synthase
VKGLLIAGTASGVGKTTVTLALLAAMRRRGLVVQTFKGGPDFLDTGHHTRIANRIARNVDTWMLSAEANKDVLRQASQVADSILVEGMMGLFDGKDATETGSSAEIAKLLRLPVVLVLDAGKSARSIAAVVLGFERFDPQLPLAGVILNRVGSERHYNMLKAAIDSVCKTPVLGGLPNATDIRIQERHPGLHSAAEADEKATEKLIEDFGSLAEKHLDLEHLFSLEREADLQYEALPPQRTKKPSLRIGVARDQAFSFYYEDNLDLLRQHGAVIVPFSPLVDVSLPTGLDALYLGGGYPELHAPQLSTNETMIASIQQFATSGLPVYAECGGMIYLSQQLITSDKTSHQMAGILPFAVETTPRLVQFGYVTVEFTRDCLLGARGTEVRGHSFHYSHIVSGDGTQTSYRVQYSLSGKEEVEGYNVGNILASYIHLHFRANPSVAQHFIELARNMKLDRTVYA